MSRGIILFFVFALLGICGDRVLADRIRGVLCCIEEKGGKGELHLLVCPDGQAYKLLNLGGLSVLDTRELFLDGSFKSKKFKFEGEELKVFSVNKALLVLRGSIEAKYSKKKRRWLVRMGLGDEKYAYIYGPLIAKEAKSLNGKTIEIIGLPLKGKDGIINPDKLKVKALSVSGSSASAFASTDRTLPKEEIKPGGTITLDLPELGNSARSGNKKPIQMQVRFPENFNPATKHPVICHFDGGTGGPGGAFGWEKVIGKNNFILLGADYSYEANKDLVKYGTCRDFDSKIAAHVLQILKNSTLIDEDALILSGVSSGAYSITDNLNGERTMKIFDAFCPICGGSGAKGKILIGKRPILFVMGEKDNQKFPNFNNKSRLDWLNEVVEQLKKIKADSRVYMMKGVGHSWGACAYPIQKEWLYSKFPHLKAGDVFCDKLMNAENEKLKKVYADYLKNSFVEDTKKKDAALRLYAPKN